MKLLTDHQKQFITRKKIKEGEPYMFPRYGFVVYHSPSEDSTCEYIDTNPFTRSLDKEMFKVKKIINGFCQGNFYNKPVGRDMYITMDELSRRDIVVVLLFYIILSIPFILYNLLTGKLW